jgi:hypothetical protein
VSLNPGVPLPLRGVKTSMPFHSLVFDSVHAPLSDTGGATQRDRHLRIIPESGRLGWQKAAKYGDRSLDEVATTRYRTPIGRRLHARVLPMQGTEAAVGCEVLNIIARRGMPASQRIA